jgi:hypothetical protein
VDFSKFQWVVKVLEPIGKDEKVRRFCYALLWLTFVIAFMAVAPAFIDAVAGILK